MQTSRRQQRWSKQAALTHHWSNPTSIGKSKRTNWSTSIQQASVKLKSIVMLQSSATISIGLALKQKFALTVIAMLTRKKFPFAIQLQLMILTTKKKGRKSSSLKVAALCTFSLWKYSYFISSCTSLFVMASTYTEHTLQEKTARTRLHKIVIRNFGTLLRLSIKHHTIQLYSFKIFSILLWS